LPASRTSAGGLLPCSMPFAGTRGNQGNSNGVNRGHEFTVRPTGESFGWQGRARQGRQDGWRRRSGDALVGDFRPPHWKRHLTM
jgi:hypothetical protein